jgi:phosphate transport system permease protein
MLTGPHLARRYRNERIFKGLGLGAIMLAALILFLLVGSIVSKGYSAFWQSYVHIDITFERADFTDADGNVTSESLAKADYFTLIRSTMDELFPEAAKDRKLRRKLYGIISPNADLALRHQVEADPEAYIGKTVPVWVKLSDDIDSVVKGYINRNLPEEHRRVDDVELSWYDAFHKDHHIESFFNVDLFTHGDSREPEEAGILGALTGSILTLIVTLALSFPVGVMAAVYLEEFAPKNKWTDLIEVNINNLAAVPSIVFGLLGLAMFLNFFGLPRSAPLVGGMVLALMTLPTIIIAARSALKAVPPSIREAALGIGASPLQTVTHHVLPLAMPGIMTGTIIGMAQALGETAPLLMIGMVAFIVDIPQSFTDPATVLPVQIYIWADSPERAFTERTSAAIMILLGVLVLMNALAVVLRKRFERRW